jgi:hypothetical protein
VQGRGGCRPPLTRFPVFGSILSMSAHLAIIAHGVCGYPTDSFANSKLKTAYSGFEQGNRQLYTSSK